MCYISAIYGMEILPRNFKTAGCERRSHTKPLHNLRHPLNMCKLVIRMLVTYLKQLAKEDKECMTI